MSFNTKFSINTIQSMAAAITFAVLALSSSLSYANSSQLDTRTMDEDIFLAQELANNEIMNWNPEIPASSHELLAHLQNQASTYTYDSDEGSCGGQVQLATMREHRRVFDTNGLPLHIVKVRFEVTMPVNFCESEKITRCEIKYNILNPAEISSSLWKCEE